MTRSLTDNEILAQIPAARRRGEISLRVDPHARAARYIRRGRMVHIDLTTGSAFLVPVAKLDMLRGASDRELREVEVSPAGSALHWESLDADYSVAFLAELAFGLKTLMRAAGRVGGSVRSPAKARAARSNGRKGGRPRKSKRLPDNQ